MLWFLRSTVKLELYWTKWKWSNLKMTSWIELYKTFNQCWNKLYIYSLFIPHYTVIISIPYLSLIYNKYFVSIFVPTTVSKSCWTSFGFLFCLICLRLSLFKNLEFKFTKNLSMWYLNFSSILFLLCLCVVFVVCDEILERS